MRRADLIGLTLEEVRSKFPGQFKISKFNGEVIVNTMEFFTGVWLTFEDYKVTEVKGGFSLNELEF